MKKIIITIIALMLFIPQIDALDIKTMYIDGEVDIAGGLHIKEYIEVENQDEDFDYRLYYKDLSLEKFDGSDDAFKSSEIYNGTKVILEKVGYLEDDVIFSNIYDNEYLEKNLHEIKDYKENDEEKYYNLIFNSNKKNTKYYIQYTIANVLVEHNDCAELYFRYLKYFKYNANEVIIITHLPYKSKLFEVWAHGIKKANVSKDTEQSVVQTTIKDYKKGKYVDNRILFDKDIFSININKSKKTNMDSIGKITLIEEQNKENTNTYGILQLCLYISVGVLFLTVIAMVLYMSLRKNKMGKKEIKKIRERKSHK